VPGTSGLGASVDTEVMERGEVDDAGLLLGAIGRARKGLVERDALVEVLALAAVAQEHVLVIGPPGTAKSQAVRRFAAELGGSYFEYLLGRFTEPNEIFGPVDLRRLREGVVAIETAGMLPSAELAFLDEVFLGSTAILNTLLGLLNERVFRRGATVEHVPLRLCVGASNRLPDDPVLAAFADRFLLRVHLEPVTDASLESLLAEGWAGDDPATPQPIGLDVIDRLVIARSQCDMTAVRPILAEAIRRLRNAGVPLTDRRAVRCQRLIAAAAVLDGRSVATTQDLWPLPFVVPSAEAQPVAREALQELLVDSRNAALGAAAEAASASPASRAQRLIGAGQSVLSEVAGPLDSSSRLRVEAVLREIDAAFDVSVTPPELGAVRDRLVAAIQQG
jgi:MoxR-like ATPase